jgi:hypothetical protein
MALPRLWMLAALPRVLARGPQAEGALNGFADQAEQIRSGIAHRSRRAAHVPFRQHVPALFHGQGAQTARQVVLLVGGQSPETRPCLLAGHFHWRSTICFRLWSPHEYFIDLVFLRRTVRRYFIYVFTYCTYCFGSF